MNEKRTILIQLDTDPLPSVFDRVVAVDAGAAEVFSYGGVTPANVVPLVHGAIFTRGPKDLHRTAIFIGGSDVAAGERLANEVRRHLLPQFGLQVSVMLDSNGANTTAVAAVRCLARHVDLATSTTLVLGATGPVGQRVVAILSRQGGTVRVGSRQLEKAAGLVEELRSANPVARLEPVATPTPVVDPEFLQGCQAVVAAGAAGVVLLQTSAWQNAGLRAAIDLNAVPPLGIEGIDSTDGGKDRQGVTCFGALGVGGIKMKIHRAAVARLFERNDQVLDAETIYALAAELG